MTNPKLADWKEACQSNDIEKVTQYLERSPDYLKDHDDQGMIALHWAADRGYLDLIRLLLSKLDTTAHHDVSIQVDIVEEKNRIVPKGNPIDGFSMLLIRFLCHLYLPG
jgi:ankyrin repeat protein